jgi:hypothetical protein
MTKMVNGAYLIIIQGATVVAAKENLFRPLLAGSGSLLI